MDILKEWAATLCVAVVFISVANIIVPNNVMKSHVKFALSLILLSIMVVPITQVISMGEEFENFNYNIVSNSGVSSVEENTKELYSSEFLRENLEKSLADTLKEQYNEKDFEVSIEGDLNISNGIDINKISIGIKDDKKIKKVEKVVIGEEDGRTEISSEEDSFVKELKEYVSKELQIDSDRIKVIYI